MGGDPEKRQANFEGLKYHPLLFCLTIIECTLLYEMVPTYVSLDRSKNNLLQFWTCSGNVG
jgi:hypothetical protein